MITDDNCPDGFVRQVKEDPVKIGSQMRAAADFVAQHPGTTKLQVAEAIGPHGSRRYGYLAVDRAIKAGLITAVRRPNGSYQLYEVVIDITKASS